MTGIPDYWLPDRLARGAELGFEWEDNDFEPTISGVENRNVTQSNARLRGDVGISLRNIADPAAAANYVKQVKFMHLAHRGRVLPFRARCPGFDTASDEWFGTGDGVTTQYQLGINIDPQKLILGTPGTLTYLRPVYLFSGAPIIKKDGTTQTVATHYTISTTGLVTFVTAPGDDLALTWSTPTDGYFGFAMRFDKKYLPLRFTSKRLAEIPDIPIVEVIGAHEITG
jgi:uncharacterized protein (TIGR02217 family)